MKTLILALGLLIAGAASAQTAPWSGSLSYDFAVNKAFAVASFSGGVKIGTPVVYVSPITVGGTYLGGGGLLAGIGGSLTVNPQGKLFGLSLKGSSVTLWGAESAVAGAPTHFIVGLTGTVSSSLLGKLIQ